jgi:hypothetical protein
LSQKHYLRIYISSSSPLRILANFHHSDGNPGKAGVYEDLVTPAYRHTQLLVQSSFHQPAIHMKRIERVLNIKHHIMQCMLPPESGFYYNMSCMARCSIGVFDNIRLQRPCQARPREQHHGISKHLHDSASKRYEQYWVLSRMEWGKCRIVAFYRL